MFSNNYIGTFNTNYCRFAVIVFRIVISLRMPVFDPRLVYLGIFGGLIGNGTDFFSPQVLLFFPVSVVPPVRQTQRFNIADAV